MCGIAGLWLTKGSADIDVGASVLLMTSALVHRGPDASGSFSDRGARLAFGHRRLSIVDLSEAGAQPMTSHSGRFVISFNGEIYNHFSLREELGSGVVWNGHSDTETLLAGIEAWGFEKTLRKCVGMFAIAVWDKQLRSLFLARDRFGEKPLYYGWVGRPDGPRAFAFASELKALRAFRGFSNAISQDALGSYFRFNYIPAPRSIYQDIYKLEPGCAIVMQGEAPDAPVSPVRPPTSHGGLTALRWWSLSEMVSSSIKRPYQSEIEAISDLETALGASIEGQRVADVPLGAFLSGGVDSSTVVSLMQKQSTRPVKTYTVGFESATFDESASAAAIARHLGTDHTAIFVSAAEARGIIPNLSTMYDEPFADSSQIPTHLVCKAARSNVTVALSGDGGDEMLGGYNRYFWAPRILQRLRLLPNPVARQLATLLSSIPPRYWDFLAGTLNVQRPGEMVGKLLEAMKDSRSLEALYLGLISSWRDSDSLLVAPPVDSKPEFLSDPSPVGEQDAVHWLMYHDSISYLPDDILCKVDRAAMAVSLETRVPYLDHRVAEIAWRMPSTMKLRGSEGKWPLRQILYKYVPREMIERPKVGFGIPVGEWLRGPLREWAETLINQPRLRAEGYLNPTVVWDIWDRHQSGRYDGTSKLWAILMFQSWLEH